VRFRLIVLALGTFAIGTGSFVFVGPLEGVARDLSVLVGAAGNLVTVFAVTYAVSSPLLVTLAGSAAPRRVLVARRWRCSCWVTRRWPRPPSAWCSCAGYSRRVGPRSSCRRRSPKRPASRRRRSGGGRSRSSPGDHGLVRDRDTLGFDHRHLLGLADDLRDGGGPGRGRPAGNPSAAT
jgi:hypothetical protein